MSSSICFSFVFGSVAKSTDKAKSDIELMVIGSDLSYTALMDLLLPIEKTLGRVINPTVYTLADFKMKLNENNSFVTRVMEQEKIVVMGNDNDIR